MWFFNVHLILLALTSSFPEKQIHSTTDATDWAGKNFWACRVLLWVKKLSPSTCPRVLQHAIVCCQGILQVSWRGLQCHNHYPFPTACCWVQPQLIYLGIWAFPPNTEKMNALKYRGNQHVVSQDSPLYFQSLRRLREKLWNERRQRFSKTRTAAFREQFS